MSEAGRNVERQSDAAGDGGQRENGEQQGDSNGPSSRGAAAMQPTTTTTASQQRSTPNPTSTTAPTSATSSSSDAAKLRQLQSMMQQAREGYQSLNQRYSTLQSECRQLMKKEEDSAATIQRLTAQVHRLSAAAAVAVNSGGSLTGIGGHSGDEEKNELDVRKDRRSSGSEVDIAVQLREQAMVDRMQRLQFDLDNQRKETDEWKAKCKEAQQQTAALKQQQQEQQLLPQRANEEIDSLRHQLQQLTLDASAIDSLALDLSVSQKERDKAERERNALRDEVQRLMAKLEEERDERDQEQAVHQHKYLTLRQKAEESDSLATQNSHLTQELALLTSSVTQLRDQLVATQRDNRTLREEADRARTERSEMETTLRRYAADMEGGQLVDRRLVVKMLTTYYERGQAQDVLDLMFRLLQFSDEERRRVLNSRRGRGWVGSVASILNPFDSEQDSSVQQRDDASVADLWVEFLLKETAKEEQGPATVKPNKAIYEAMASPSAANSDSKPAAARFFSTPQPQRITTVRATSAVPPASSIRPSIPLQPSLHTTAPVPPVVPLPSPQPPLAYTQSAPPAASLQAIPTPFRPPVPLSAKPIALHALPPHIRAALPPPGRPLAAPPPSLPLPSHPLFSAGLPMPRAAVPGQPVSVARPASPAPPSGLP